MGDAGKGSDSGCGLFSAADLADEFRGKAEKGGDHILGDTLDKIGEAAGELMITFLTG